MSFLPAAGCGPRRLESRCLLTALLTPRLLFLKLVAQNEREQFAFCSVKGCERIKIKALIPKGASVSDCTAAAYPRFAEWPTVDVPMPRKLSPKPVSCHLRHSLGVGEKME